MSESRAARLENYESLKVQNSMAVKYQYVQLWYLDGTVRFFVATTMRGAGSSARHVAQIQRKNGYSSYLHRNSPASGMVPHLEIITSLPCERWHIMLVAFGRTHQQSRKHY